MIRSAERERAPKNEERLMLWLTQILRKKSKITAVPTAFSLGGNIFGGSMTNSASTRKSCLQSCNFRFFPLGVICLNQAE